MTSDTAISHDLAVTAEQSRQEQQKLEAADTFDFDAFLAAYLAN